MKNNKVKFESDFEFGEKVVIEPLEVEGTIESFWLAGPEKLLIEVRYIIDNKVVKEYFYGDELRVIKETKTGFTV